jgi:D-alanine-D-alanine ligase
MAVKIMAQHPTSNSSREFGKIGVLMGGPSSERDISLKSGKAVVDALKQLGIQVEPIDIITDNAQENIRLIKSFSIDCAFIALHGRYGEDGTIQEILEGIGIPYTGSGVKASRLAMDKVASLEIFSRGGLAVPEYKVVNKDSKDRKNSLGYPLVVKPATHGSSIGLSIINKEDELEEAIKTAFKYDCNVIVQKYVKGRELTVGILDEKALPVIEIVPKNFFFDYEAKYKQGMTEYVVPAKLENSVALKVQEVGLSAHKMLGCFACSRADIILTDDLTPYILEINTIPGMTATSLLPKAAGITGLDFGQLCIYLLRLAYAKKQV